MDKVEQLKELISYYGGTQVAFANKIGRKQSHVANWLCRGNFDAVLISKCCTEISAEWLLRGEGPMLKQSQSVKTEEKNKNEKIRELESKLKEKEIQIQLLSNNLEDVRRMNQHFIDKDDKKTKVNYQDIAAEG